MKQTQTPIMVTLGIDTHSPSGIGAVPSLYREVRIKKDLAKALYDASRIYWDVTNQQYGCWSEEFDARWLDQ